jgi:hypothetical protein
MSNCVNIFIMRVVYNNYVFKDKLYSALFKIFISCVKIEHKFIENIYELTNVVNELANVVN